MAEIIEKSHELSNNRVIVDPRPFYKKLWDSLQYPVIPLCWSLFSTLAILIWPGFIPFAFAIFIILWLAVISKPDVLPIHLPMEAHKIDMNDPKPGGKGFYMARGSFYLGRIREKNTELWVSFKAMTQHFLIFGTTGAGKTESIVSYIVNYLSVGSGVAFQDAKAAPKAMIQNATFCRIFGRDDDMRVTNYITGLSSEHRDPAERMSNDAAVFSRGSAESNTQMLVSLMPPSEGENKIFAERAVALLSALMPALTDLRDLGKLQIDPGTIRKYMGFKAFASLYRNNSIRKRSRDALVAYLESLSGYDDTKEIADQQEEVTRQFGFAQAYFTRSLASLSDTYGHIYMTGQGEIDYQDAVLNGRILLTLLPSMEKSGEELSNLGKIVLTATKNGMVVGLGTVFEGSAEDIVHNLPTNSDIPYGVINDENAYMLVEGQEMINAQARGLGFGVITGTQDAPGMLLGLEKTTKQIMANSAFKQIMYLDDKDTTDLAIDFAGEASVLVRNTFTRDGDLGSVYAAPNVSLEKRPRLSGTAIKKQGLGQAYLMYQGNIHEAQVFNHGIQEKGKDPLMRYVDHWFPVRMAKVKIVDEAVLDRYIRLYPKAVAWQQLKGMLNDESRHMLKEMTTYFSSMLLMNRIARLSFLESEAAVVQSFLSPDVEEPVGLVERIIEGSIQTIEDTLPILIGIAQKSPDGHVAVQRMGDEAGLDAILGLELPPEPFPFDTDADTGGSSGGGGSLKMQPADDGAGALDDFLSGSNDDFASAVKAAVVEAEAAISAPVVVASERQAELIKERNTKPRSDIGGMVERNLENMPWMASAVDYATTRDTLVQSEMFFNGGDEAKAQEVAEAAMNGLANAMQYPKTAVPRDDRRQERIKASLKGFVDF